VSFVYRPKSKEGRIHSKDEFELCYIRHKYFRKTLHNPTSEEMYPYKKIVETQARHTFFTYRHLLQAVGFDIEDVASIGCIHLVSFLGLFSLESIPTKYEEFAYSYKKLNGSKATPNDFLSKNKANFTMFLKQRMEDIVRICRQKVRNVKGVPVETMYYFYGKQRPPEDTRKLLDGYESYGFKKIDLSSFRTIKKRSKKKTAQFYYGRKWYVAVPMEQKKLELVDFSGAGLDPYDNIHNMNPEQILFHKQEEDFWEQKKEDFRNKPKDDRVEMVVNFIKTNRNNPHLEEEIKTAERYLKRLGVSVER
jgi:hypothetical protein